MEKLTNEETKVLCDALDAWIEKGIVGEMMTDIISSMLTLNPQVKQKIEQEDRARKQKAREEKELRKRTATLLKAKLYKMEMSAMAGE